MPSIALSDYLRISPRYADTSNIGGAAFEAQIGHAVAAIEAGLCEVALVVYGSLQRSERGRGLGGRPTVLMNQHEMIWGLPQPVGGYALAAARYMHCHGVTREQLAEVAVSARRWGALNPAATRRDPISIDDVLTSARIADPLGLLDCCLVTDGAGAVVLTSARHAKAAGKLPIYVRGYGESSTHIGISQMPDLARLTAAELSGKSAFERAGLRPDQIDFAQIYDSFTITVLLTLEALGFCGRGEAGSFVSGGRIAPGGDFAMNTSGGGLSFCHPGMFGIFLVIEAVRQMRGECGDRQLKKTDIALVHGTGGTLSSGATCILARS
jgi:acetyl-CoA acetyltransferase